MREFLAELQSRGRSLVAFGWLNLTLALLFLIFWGSTDAAVMGINAWIKPLKFALSITLYSFTFAWLLSYLKSERHRNVIGWTLIVCMSAEILVIALQAARGETSHYNTSSPLNAALFATMGLFIGVNTLECRSVGAFYVAGAHHTGRRTTTGVAGGVVFLFCRIAGRWIDDSTPRPYRRGSRWWPGHFLL